MRILRSFFILLTVASALSARTARITLLATTDVHGNLLPYDYFTAEPSPRGLAKISKLVAAARAENPNTILIDCGDAIQGSPLEGVHQYSVRNGRLPLDLTGPKLNDDPVMLAMNHMGYDAMVLGNHEFNYGLKNLDRARATAKFPWLSANTRVSAGASNQAFEPYLLKTIDGVRVAIIGVTTPSIPMWDEPQNYRGYEFQSIVRTIENTVRELRAKQHPDVIIVAAHSGLGADLKSGTPFRDEVKGENAMYEVASKVKGIDAIVFGHNTANCLPRTWKACC